MQCAIAARRSILRAQDSRLAEFTATSLKGYHQLQIFNNTCKSRSLVACALKAEVDHFVFSSSAATYGLSPNYIVSENAELRPISPYSSSKLMTEIMLRDAAFASPLRYVALRYFNVAGADPRGRAGQSTPNASHLIKVAVQAALKQRSQLEVFGDDYSTPDRTCVRDYVHVSDLARAHVSALDYLRAGGRSEVLNCGYGNGFFGARGHRCSKARVPH